MALLLRVENVEGLDGTGDRQLKVKFRDKSHSSKVASGDGSVEFDQQFEWPVTGQLQAADLVEIRVYSYSKYLANKLIGTATVGLQQLITEHRLRLREQLVDTNRAILKTTADIELVYRSSNPELGRSHLMANSDDENEGSETQLLLRESRPVQSLRLQDDASETGTDDPAVMRKSLDFPVVLHPTMHRLEDFQLSVTIIEAKQLAGANINPCIEVCVGDRVKRTEIQMSTNSPYYNQYFAFEFHTSKSELFDQVIHIRAINKGTMMIARLFAGELIGEFRLDVRTVYDAPDHMFTHKWACLIDPKDILGGPKGYVKCDISVIGKGEQLKDQSKPQPKKGKPSDEDDIEANLLLPSGVPVQRQMAEISVKIYRAEDLPKMNTDFMASLKQAFTRDSKPMADPFVQISFAGHTARTKSKKSTYDPQWNEAIVFTEMFPPLCNRIRIGVYDQDAMYNECIATHFIELGHIMSDAESGFMPTFGPSWINLYGTPRNYGYENAMHRKDELNLGQGEGVAYRGRLLLAIKTEVKSDSGGLVSGARVTATQPVPDNVAGKREDFLLSGIIYEAGAIDSEVGKRGKPISFELSIGTCGNSHAASGASSEADDGESVAESKATAATTAAIWCHSCSAGKIAKMSEEDCYFVPFDERKPSLYVRCSYEDHRPRMFVPNILEKLISKFEQATESASDAMTRHRRSATRRLQRSLQEFAESLDACIVSIRGCKGSGGKTLLDMQRQKMVRLQLEKMKVKVKSMRAQLTEESAPLRLKECRALIRLLKELREDEQHSLPDVFVWLLCDGEQVAFARLPARQILHSESSEERGRDCGKVVTLFLRKPGRKGMGQGGWSLQCQLKMFLWLGLLKDIASFRSTVPDGYAPDTFRRRRPPKEIVYTERSVFEFRAYVFMARNLIGSDESGLSDAFARIVLNEHVLSTHVIEESLSPMWDRTLAANPVVFYLNELTVFDHPPVAVVEIFDEDQVKIKLPFDKAEFLGRCFCQPSVTLQNSSASYRAPQLQWWEIYRGQMNAGELLAAFELVQLDSKGQTPKSVPSLQQLKQSLSENEAEVDERREADFVPVPNSIRPRLAPYRIEILFWGVRELTKIQFQSVQSPKITVEFGGRQLPSDAIVSCRAKPNFPNNLKCLHLLLPEDRCYWPPLMFQCEDCRQFGRTVLVGNHVIASVVNFVKKEEIDKSAAMSDTVSVTTTVKTGLQQLQQKEKRQLKFTSIAKSVLMSSKSSGHNNPAFSPDEDKSVAGSRRQSLVSSRQLVGKSTSLSNGKSTKPQSLEVVANPGDIRLEPPRPNDAASTSRHSDTQPLVPLMEEAEGSVAAAIPGKPGGAMEINLPPKKKPANREDLQDLDWWSRFYATMGDLQDEDDDDDESDDEQDILKDIEIDLKSEADDTAGIIGIPEEDEDPDEKKKRKKKDKKNKKKKKKQKKKKKKRKLRLPFGKDARAEYLAEKDDEIAYEAGITEDNSWISRIKMYQCPLEDVKEFNGFEKLFCTFPIYRGKQEEDDEPSDNREVGVFKGNICIYQISHQELKEESPPVSNFLLHKDLPSNEPLSVLVRVYVVRCIDLHPADPNGKSDPYLIIRLGSTTINEKENYIPKQLNPVFGKCFEIEAKFPQESNLQVVVMDWDMLSGDDLIGETKIDLENRFFSSHRATCGLSLEYASSGYNKWRDQQQPTSILSRWCRDHDIPQPIYETHYCRVSINGHTFYEHVEIEDETGKKVQSNEPLALKVLQNWETVAGVALVPEHTESRPLYTPEKAGIEQGRIEMWVDMFPKEFGAPPAPVDITPRQPISYELRVIVWDTEEVKLNDTGLTGEASSDIFVKGWMKGLGIDDQVTDVHYRSLNGEGNFNWRFVFQFDYLKAEDKIVYKIKDSPFAIDEEEKKAMCKVLLQVWDADIVSSDDFLGGIELSLSKMPRGSKSAKTCDIFLMEKDSGVKTFSLFRNKRCRGWWPFIGESEDDSNDKELAGKIDAELQLLTAAEAEANPVGLGRAEPQPLPPPNRPETSFLTLLNPLKVIRYLVCIKYRWLLLKLLILILIAAIFVLFMYSSPGYLAKKIIGA